MPGSYWVVGSARTGAQEVGRSMCDCKLHLWDMAHTAVSAVDRGTVDLLVGEAWAHSTSYLPVKDIRVEAGISVLCRADWDRCCCRRSLSRSSALSAPLQSSDNRCQKDRLEPPVLLNNNA